MRLTYRTMRVLAAVASQPGSSNRTIAEAAGIKDKGQTSKLLARLAGLGLIESVGNGRAHGTPYAWKFTPRGERFWREIGARESTETRQRAVIHSGGEPSQAYSRISP